MADESVGEIAALYLGNILYALEATALQYDEQEQREHSAFYRGIARKLADARGRERAGEASASDRREGGPQGA